MKHDVVVASPRAGITRDKYSANKSRHPTPACPPPSPGPLPLPLTPHYLRNVARGWRARPPAIFNKSSRVSHGRWPPMRGDARDGGRRRGRSMYSKRVLFRCHAHVRSVSLFFFSFFFFFALVLRHRSIFFSSFLVDAGLLGNYQSGSSDRKYPAHPPLVSAASPPSFRLSFLLPFVSPPSPLPPFCRRRRRRHRHTFTDQFVR